MRETRREKTSTSMREGFTDSASTSVDTSFKLCDRITLGSPKLDPTTPQNLEEKVAICRGDEVVLPDES